MVWKPCSGRERVTTAETAALAACDPASRGWPLMPPLPIEGPRPWASEAQGLLEGYTGVSSNPPSHSYPKVGQTAQRSPALPADPLLMGPWTQPLNRCPPAVATAGPAAPSGARSLPHRTNAPSKGLRHACRPGTGLHGLDPKLGCFQMSALFWNVLIRSQKHKTERGF